MEEDSPLGRKVMKLYHTKTKMSIKEKNEKVTKS